MLPIAGGLGFIALLGLVTWGIAALIGRHPQQLNESLARSTFEVGNTASIASLIADEGPLLFQGLIGTSADRSIVLDHSGNDIKHGWHVYFAHPADRQPTCKVSQIQGTRQFTDCAGRTLDVEQLAPPPAGVNPVVGDRVTIDLIPDTQAASASTPSPTTPSPTTS